MPIMSMCFLRQSLRFIQHTTFNSLLTPTTTRFIIVLYLALLGNNVWAQEPEPAIATGDAQHQDTPNSNNNIDNTMNRAPVAINDVVSTTLNKTITINVLENDTDPDNDPLDIIKHTTPENGTIEQQGKTFRYTPNAHFTGIDTFDYTISDGKFVETTATASSTAIAVLSPDGDFTDTDTFTFIISNDENGDIEATTDADGIATISRNTEDMPNNTEMFTFTVSDTEGEAIATAMATVAIATNDAEATASATAIAVNTPTESFVETETFTYTLASNNNTASADSMASAEIIYTPADNHFSYRVLNPQGEAVKATTVAIAMAAANATVTAMTMATATVNIEVKHTKPTFTLANTSYTTTPDTGKVQVPAWITQATDGLGNTQRPHATDKHNDHAAPIYFYVTSNSNPDLFNKQPWLSYPSHSLHFTTKADTQGNAEICAKAVTQRGRGEASDIQCFTIIITDENIPTVINVVSPPNTNYTNTTEATNDTQSTSTPTTSTVRTTPPNITPSSLPDATDIDTNNSIGDLNMSAIIANNTISNDIGTNTTPTTVNNPATTNTTTIPNTSNQTIAINTDTTGSNDENKNSTASNVVTNQAGSGGSLDVFVIVFLASLVFLRKKYNLLINN